jgi:hypothetical protein
MECWSDGVMVIQEGKGQMKDKTGAGDHEVLSYPAGYRLLYFFYQYSNTPVLQHSTLPMIWSFS